MRKDNGFMRKNYGEGINLLDTKKLYCLPSAVRMEASM